MPFALDKGEPVRHTLMRVSNAEHWVHLCVHNIVVDGWSIVQILLRELSALIVSSYAYE